MTALDVSSVALGRALKHASDAGVQVEWVQSGLEDAGLPPASFELVSAQYPALLRTPARTAERALIGAVAPGGVLLVVHHVIDPEHARAHGFDPADFVSPADVAALLDEDWQIEVNEVRPRTVAASSSGAQHVEDIVLRARRRA